MPALRRSSDLLRRTSTQESPAAEPKAEFSSTCDILLGVPSPNYFVADDEISNTGNVGIVVRVLATMPLTRWLKGAAPRSRPNGLWTTHDDGDVVPESNPG